MPALSSVSGAFGYGRPNSTLPIVTSNMLLYLDATNSTSYPGSGTTWTDLSLNANNATSLTGFTYSSTNGGFISFNGSGSGSLVSTKYNTTYTGKTVFVVGRLASAMGTSTYRAFLGDSTGNRNFNFYLYCTPSNTYQLHFSAGGSGSLSSNLPFTVGAWFTAAVTQKTDGTIVFYFNGVQVNQTTQTFVQYQSGTTEWVGRADNYWNGPLATICVYTIALSAADILTNHNAVKNRYGI